MRVHTEQITVDDADVLGGTSLDVLEEGGQLDVFVLSSAADTLMTITGPNAEPIAVGVEVPNETRAPRPNDDTPLSIPIETGGHYTINIDIVAAATVILLAIYRKAGVDF